jgi:hypothetical protein
VIDGDAVKLGRSCSSIRRDRPRRTPRRIPGEELVPKVRRRGDRQHAADRLDPVRRAVVVDERHHYFARRSSSAGAKYADAFRRISFARLSSKFSLAFQLLQALPLVGGQA